MGVSWGAEVGEATGLAELLFGSLNAIGWRGFRPSAPSEGWGLTAGLELFTTVGVLVSGCGTGRLGDWGDTCDTGDRSESLSSVLPNLER